MTVSLKDYLNSAMSKTRKSSICWEHRWPAGRLVWKIASKTEDGRDIMSSLFTAISELRAASDELKDYQVIRGKQRRFGKVKTPIGEKNCYNDMMHWD